MAAGVVTQRDLPAKIGREAEQADGAFAGEVGRHEVVPAVAHVLEDIDLEDLEQGIPEDLEVAVLDLINRARRRRTKGRRSPRRTPSAA